MSENLRALIQGDPGRAGGRSDAPGTGASPRSRRRTATVVHAEGDLRGNASHEPGGLGGFGYDPIFVPVGWDVTMAELDRRAEGSDQPPGPRLPGAPGVLQRS